MKKRISLDYSLEKMQFKGSAAYESGGSVFIVHGGEKPLEVAIHTSLMHRLYRLGQAYGFRNLRYLESESKLIIGEIDVKSFLDDICKLKELVNDGALHECIDKLVNGIESVGDKHKHIVVSTGNYFTK